MTITRIYATGPLDLTTLPAAAIRAGLNAVRQVEDRVPGITAKYEAALEAVEGRDGADCPKCDGTGNFYRNDEDGDFLPCDECHGTGVEPPNA